MKVDLKNKISEEAQNTDFFDTLPEEVDGFILKKIFAEDDDKFIYFRYENEKIHRGLTAYFHGETEEYKIRVKIGLTEFCLTKFFTENFSDYCQKISAELEKILENLSDNQAALSSIIKEKNFADWNYGKNLPQNIAGFELFIAPQNPVEFTNGSYIIINYSDFSAESDFTLCYNIYTENFSGEFTVNRVSQVSYLFDADNLADLEKNLQENLSAELLKIRNNLHGVS